MTLKESKQKMKLKEINVLKEKEKDIIKNDQVNKNGVEEDVQSKTKTDEVVDKTDRLEDKSMMSNVKEKLRQAERDKLATKRGTAVLPDGEKDDVNDNQGEAGKEVKDVVMESAHTESGDEKEEMRRYHALCEDSTKKRD